MSRPPSLITTIVQAGAGTGKTESLANRIIDLAEIIYSEKMTVPRFVATTFTERATSELRERVVSLLARRKDVPHWLTEFVQDTQDLHISTIHGTLSLILHRFGSLLGLDPEFTILSATEENEILSRVLRDCLAQNPHLSILLEHYSLVELIESVKKLNSHKRLHGPSFKSADGWKIRFEKEKQEFLNALALFEAADLSNLPPSLNNAVQVFQTLNRRFKSKTHTFDEVRGVFLETIGQMKKPVVRVDGRGSELKSAVDEVFSFKKRNGSKDHWGSDTYDPIINERHDEIAILMDELISKSVESVQGLKNEAGVLTFDDLEFLSLELIEKHPETLNSIRQEWDFWFVDEFQDTSPLQKKLLFSFFRNPWNAYFVGDPQQSIYLFRGADENVFQDTKKLVFQNGGALERLKTNYRSHPNLLAFMNYLFENMTHPIEPLEARGPLENEVRAQVHLASEGVDEDRLVLEQITQWKRQGYSFHDMAVLVKTNDKARLIGRTLGAAGVPVYIHSSGGYYDRREVLDALSLLSFIEDPSDDDVFIVLARSPWMGVPDEILAEWGQKRERKSFWDWLNENPSEFDKVKTLGLLRLAVRQAETRPLSMVFENLIDKLGFLEFCLMGDASGRREANLRKFFWTLKKAEKSAGFSAAHFIANAWRELTEVGEESEAASFIEPQRVNIMTIHKSKGLKFNCVVVPYSGDALRSKTTLLELAPDGRWALRVLALDSEEKVSPLMHVSLKEGRFERELAESDRVFYVAVTRAAEELSLIASMEANAEGKSWFSHCRLDLTEGVHKDLYKVTRWAANPAVEKIFETEAEEKRRPLQLPVLKDALITQLNVTRLVQNRFLNRSIDETKKAKTTTLASFEFHLETQQRGQAIHLIFEEYKYNPQLGVKKLCDLARIRFPARLKIDDVLIERALELKTPPLKKLIKDGHTEWPFIFVEKNMTLEGQIDLWGEVNGETWIIDYKSAEAFTPEAIEKAKEQLELYALAVNKYGAPWEKIKIAIIAPLQKENFKILELSSRDEIVSRLVPLETKNWADAE